MKTAKIDREKKNEVNREGNTRVQEILQARRVQIINDAEKEIMMGNTEVYEKLESDINPNERKSNHFSQMTTEEKKI